MLGSSSRVKLNRVALKEMKLEPRRRRVTKSLSDVQEENQVVSELVSASVSSSHEPVQTSLKGPGNVTDATANIAGEEGEPEEEMKAEKKRSSYHQEVKHEEEGPFTRGKYQQSKPNTRSKGSLHGGIRRLCDLRLKFTWCFCTASDRRTQVVKHRTQVRRHRGVKLRSTVSKMACQMEQSSKAIKSLKSSVGKSSVRCIKTRVTRVVNKTGRVKARSTRCDPHGDPQTAAAAAAAADTGQVHTGTQSTATGQSSKVHLSLELGVVWFAI